MFTLYTFGRQASPRELISIAVKGSSYHHGDLAESLIEAGLEITRVGGPQALTIREVTRRVGVSPNAAYRHFADRQALLWAVAERIELHVMATMAAPEAVTENREPRAALRAIGIGYIEFALDEPGWFEVIMAALDPAVLTEGGPPARPAVLLGAVLDQLVLAGELTKRQRVDAEWACWSAVHGFALLALHGPLAGRSRPQLRRAAARTVDAVIAGLAC